jgi:hypothetical protein
VGGRGALGAVALGDADERATAAHTDAPAAHDTEERG